MIQPFNLSVAEKVRFPGQGGWIEKFRHFLSNLTPCSSAKLTSEIAIIHNRHESLRKEVISQLEQNSRLLNDFRELIVHLEKSVNSLPTFINNTLEGHISSSAKSVSNNIANLGTRNMECAKETISAINSCAGSLRRQIREVHNQEDGKFALILKSLSENTTSMIRALNDTRTLYYDPIEVKSVEVRGLSDLTSRPNFAQEYASLVAGLPEESRTIVNRIICRLRQLKGLNGRKDLYTAEEKEAIRKINAFADETLSITEELHCWHKYLLPVNHFSPNVFLYRYGMNQLTDKTRFRYKAIIDVGAYIGDSALILSEYTESRVYCFEASSANYAHLLLTIKLNGLNHIIAENMALGDSDGELLLRQCKDRSSSDERMVPEPVAIEHCPMTTLDAYVHRSHIDVGLIKVDIEGAEQAFLHGARQTIIEQRPTLMISIYHNADDFLHIKPMIETMDAGYTFKIYHPPIKSIVNETLLICEQPHQHDQ